MEAGDGKEGACDTYCISLMDGRGVKERVYIKIHNNTNINKWMRGQCLRFLFVSFAFNAFLIEKVSSHFPCVAYIKNCGQVKSSVRAKERYQKKGQV